MSDNRRTLRFGVGTLLFLMLCLGGYLTGYRLGEDEKQTQAQQVAHNTVIYSQVYDVGDLLSFDPHARAQASDFDDLIFLILTTVASETWVENGGPSAEIRPFPTNKSIVVSNTRAVHDEIADLLEQLRRSAYELDPDELMTAVREASARKQQSPQMVKLYTLTSDDVHRIVSGHFDSGLELLTKRLGRPAAVYSSDRDDFPTWIAAQRVAVWPQGNGRLYWALQDALPQGEAVVAGWHQEGMTDIRPLSYTPTLAAAQGE